jgi:uncharacterized membrane protein YedE/YeeE
VTPSSLGTRRELWLFLLAGIVFGVVITKAEVISWFRMQEMFRFQGFHMFGIFGTALPVASASVQLLKRRGARAISGERISTEPKPPGVRRYALGGVIFGVGWTFTGACPGPLFALLGSGVGVMAGALLGAVAGTWAYGALRARLPH